tara:strand:+ start:5380 stop:6858 length:1479 start_codon:yes stop_codon:yes gene_type:complete
VAKFHLILSEFQHINNDVYTSPRVSRPGAKCVMGDKMFSSLSDKLTNIVSSIKGKAVISEDDLDSTLRDIRVALLEADVSLEVVKQFITSIKSQALGQDVLKNIQPDQMIVKIVYDELVDILGSKNEDLILNTTPPAVILFCGLQGSGKTTSLAKLAKLLKDKQNKKILTVSADIYRPAAQEQLKILSDKNDINFFETNNTKDIKKIISNSLLEAKKELYDILLIDTAGRQVLNEDLMGELRLINEISSPIEKILVSDSLSGQDAATTAKKFHDLIGITGVFLTRVDGDSRGGAALSVKSVTGAPIKFLGMGEKIDQIENFHPDRIAKRILGMGDIVSLVEKASQNVEEEDIKKISKKISEGNFDLNDFASQIKQMKKVGGVSGMLTMLPGVSKAQKAMAEKNISDDILIKQLAIISSMTLKEKKHPEIIKASRKIRISKGSGTKVQDVNKLLKQFLQSQKMLKRMKNMGGGQNPSSLLNKLKGNIPQNFLN